MALRDDQARGEEHEVRLGRFGRLIAVPPSDADRGAQVRCACDRCGAHLLAVRAAGGLTGTCPVCLSQQFEPVEGPR